MKPLRLVVVASLVGIPLWLRQLRFERYAEKRAQLLEIAVAENLGGFVGEVNAAFGEVVEQANKNFKRISAVIR